MRRRLQELGFWFVDIPRTSSTAIRAALYRRHGKLFGRPSHSQGLGMGLVPPHLPAQWVEHQVGAETWNTLYRFSIVRNPFERVVSLYVFLRANGKMQTTDFSDYVTSLVSGGGFDYHGHYLDNSGYLLDASGDLMVDDVFRFEDRAGAMPLIAEKTACPELLHPGKETYKTERTHYSAYFDMTSRRRVEDYFAADLERFGYRFEAA